LVLHFLWPKTSGLFNFFCKFEAIQIYAILFANKTFLDVKNRKKKNSFKKKVERPREANRPRPGFGPRSTYLRGRSDMRRAASSR
jgi:hypothetical protein